MLTVNGVAAQAAIMILLTPDGQISTQMKGELNRPLANMMLETAKQDVLMELMKAENAAKSGAPSIAIAGPGTRIPGLRG